MEELPMYRFVITGGPCGGKTTAIAEMQSYLRENGFRVFIVPEAATLLFLNGASPNDLADPACQQAFQRFVINTQLQLEESYAVYGRSCKQKCVLLCDRGIMDGAAYVNKEVWSSVLAEQSMDTLSAREGRYNAVFHLVTAANGAAAHYTLENNDARHETPEEAISADNNTQAAWHGHPHHIVIDNRNGRPFDQKMAYLRSVLSSYVGLPSERPRCLHKYKLSPPPNPSSFPDNTEIFDIEKTMLSSDLDSTDSSSDTDTACERILYSFLRKRSQGGFHAYGLTTVKMLCSGEVVQLKCILSPHLYSTLLATKADPRRKIVRQRRYCFRAEHQSFHVSHWIDEASPAATTTSTTTTDSDSEVWFAVIQCESEPKVPAYLHTGPELSSTPSLGKEYSFREMSLK